MKTYTFKLFGRTFTFHFGRKKQAALNEPKEVFSEEFKMEEKDKTAWPTFNPVYHGSYTSTVNEPDVPNDPSLYGCCIEYIESQRGTLADSTLARYRNIIDNHFDSIMEMLPISKITEELIQKSFDEEIAKNLSEKTLKGYRSFILKVLAIYRPDLKPEIRVIPWEERPQWVKTKETWK